jgi:hypothetical protein
MTTELPPEVMAKIAAMIAPIEKTGNKAYVMLCLEEMFTLGKREAARRIPVGERLPTEQDANSAGEILHGWPGCLGPMITNYLNVCRSAKELDPIPGHVWMPLPAYPAAFEEPSGGLHYAFIEEPQK